jgi:hypothetical protein
LFAHDDPPAVDKHPITGFDSIAECTDFTVDFDSTLLDPTLDLAARAKTHGR